MTNGAAPEPGAIVAAEPSNQEHELQLFRFIVENSDEEVMLLKPDGRFAYANPAALKSLGYTREQLEQLTLAHIDAEQGNNFAERFALVKGMPESHPAAETTHTTRDGRSIPKEVHAFYFKAGDAEYVCAFARDISDRKKLEAERARLEEATLHAQTMEAVSRLAGGIAHDFNNLLTSIRGYAEILLATPNTPPELTVDVQEIKNAADRAAELTEQLLAFGRRQLISPVTLELNELLQKAAPTLKALLGDAIRLQLECSDETAVIRADPHQLHQILIALLTNAREAMPEGGNLTLTIRHVTIRNVTDAPANCRPGTYVALVVTDTGRGMDPGTRTHLFEPFFTTKERGRGTGLSLPAVYGIVQQHGAAITVDSERGKGSTFTLYFPSVAAPVARPTPVAQPQTPPQRATILLVEDEVSVQRLAARVLRDAGYEVLTADHAEAALQVANNHDGKIDLLVTDVIMPGLNGRELAEVLTGRRPGLRVLYMSGYTEDILADHGVMSDEVPFIMKPFGLPEFRAKVHSILDEKSR